MLEMLTSLDFILELVALRLHTLAVEQQLPTQACLHRCHASHVKGVPPGRV